MVQADLVAGLTVGVMTVPQSLSYARIAGLPSQFGLYGAFAPVLGYALFGSSRQLVCLAPNTPTHRPAIPPPVHPTLPPSLHKQRYPSVRAHVLLHLGDALLLAVYSRLCSVSETSEIQIFSCVKCVLFSLLQ